MVDDEDERDGLFFVRRLLLPVEPPFIRSVVFESVVPVVVPLLDVPVSVVVVLLFVVPPVVLEPIVPVEPEPVVPVEPEPVVVPVEPEPVVEFVVCAFALRTMPATSIQPMIITFFIVELFVINHLTLYCVTPFLQDCFIVQINTPKTCVNKNVEDNEKGQSPYKDCPFSY